VTTPIVTTLLVDLSDRRYHFRYVNYTFFTLCSSSPFELYWFLYFYMYATTVSFIYVFVDATQPYAPNRHAKVFDHDVPRHFTRGQVSTTTRIDDRNFEVYKWSPPTRHVRHAQRRSRSRYISRFRDERALVSRTSFRHALVPSTNTTRTRRLSRPRTTAHGLRYELACAPTQTRTPEHRAPDEKAIIVSTPSHTRRLLMSTTIILRRQKYVFRLFYLRARIASKTF
jgi:hypothetical protein